MLEILVYIILMESLAVKIAIPCLVLFGMMPLLSFIIPSQASNKDMLWRPSDSRAGTLVVHFVALRILEIYLFKNTSLFESQLRILWDEQLWTLPAKNPYNVGCIDESKRLVSTVGSTSMRADTIAIKRQRRSQGNETCKDVQPAQFMRVNKTWRIINDLPWYNSSLSRVSWSSERRERIRPNPHIH